jgi:hypothetical protein
MKKIWSAVLAAVVIGIPAWGLAAEGELPITIQRYESISYYSGGVGVEERKQLPQLYLLKLVFTTNDGQLLSDADVTVSKAGNPVFRGRAENGPWMFIDLPPGAYRIEAFLNGKTRTADGVRLQAGKLRTVVLRWKSTDVDMGL